MSRITELLRKLRIKRKPRRELPLSAAQGGSLTTSTDQSPSSSVEELNSLDFQGRVRHGQKLHKDDKQSTGDNPPQLEYQKLNGAKEEIRLLRIVSEPDSLQIQCSLTHTACNRILPIYTAVSYCWGDPNDTIPIIVENRTLCVTRNLEAALRELRRREYGNLWIDAICINQADDSERGLHVQRMGDIYKNAIGTVAWLGPYQKCIDEAIPLLKLMAAKEPESEFREQGHLLWEVEQENSKPHPLMVLMVLPYWERTWIIQEIVVSKSPLFLWGESEIDTDILYNAMQSVEAMMPQRRYLEAGARLIINLLSMRRNNMTHVDNKGMDLQIALSRSIRSQASDQRDKIYGLLGLCYDGRRLVPNPNYHQSIDTILRDITIARLLDETENGKRVNSGMDLLCLDNPVSAKRKGFPTWANDWTVLWKLSDSGRCSSRTSRCLKTGYRACGDSTCSVTFSDDLLTLNCHGYKFDVVESLSACVDWRQGRRGPRIEDQYGEEKALNLQDNVYGSEKDLFTTIWRSLVQDRTVDKKSRAPSLYSFEFRKLFTDEASILGYKRSQQFGDNLAIIADFKIYGRTLREWSQDPKFNDEQNGKISNPNSEVSDSASLKEFVRAILPPTFYQRILVSKKGYVGIAHSQSQLGDVITLLQGATVPMLLRPYKGGFKVVGEAYVHGIMNGDYWRKLVADEEMRQFHLT